MKNMINEFLLTILDQFKSYKRVIFNKVTIKTISFDSSIYNDLKRYYQFSKMFII
jgi:hypothetical protein